MLRDQSSKIGFDRKVPIASPKATRFKSWPWFEGVFLIVVPLTYLLLGPFQLFPPPGWVDPVMYLGYFLDFPRKLAEFGPTYHAMRLPFTLVGFVLHRIFSPKFANYILVLGFHYLALLSVYFAVRARHSRAAAVSTALFLALNPLWIATVACGYVDGPGMAFLFASLACLANRGGAMSPITGAIMAGALAALAAFCNAFAGLVTVLALLSWLFAVRTSWRELWWIALCGMGGALVVTLALCLTSRILHGPFFFFHSSINFGTQALGGFGTNYRVPLGEWIPSSYRLALPVGFLCTGLFVLFGIRRVPSSSSLLIAGCVTIVLTSSWFLLFDLGIGATTLQFAHYGSYLIPGQCLAFGGLAAILLFKDESQSRPNWASVSAVTVAAIVVLFASKQIWAFEARWRSIYLIWFVVALLFAMSMVLIHRRVTPIGLATLMFATALVGTANADTRRVFRLGPNPDYKPFYEMLVNLNSIVDSIRPMGRPFYIWYCRECLRESQRDDWRVVELRYKGNVLRTNMLDSMASLWLWDSSWLNYTMPSLAAEDIRKLTAGKGSTLVLLCPQEAACAEAVAALHRAGVETDERARVPLSARGLLDVTVLIEDLESERIVP
jgi:hypothetical protein